MSLRLADAYWPSCAPAWRWRQGHALRVLRNLDPAGRGRKIENAGSEGMPFLPHQENSVSVPSATVRCITTTGGARLNDGEKSQLGGSNLVLTLPG
jgi:hypothetical protein